MFLDGISQVLEEHLQAVNFVLRKHMSFKRMMCYVCVSVPHKTKLLYSSTG